MQYRGALCCVVQVESHLGMNQCNPFERLLDPLELVARRHLLPANRHVVEEVSNGNGGTEGPVGIGRTLPYNVSSLYQLDEGES
jgi:hypothetical protein